MKRLSTEQPQTETTLWRHTREKKEAIKKKHRKLQNNQDSQQLKLTIGTWVRLVPTRLRPLESLVGKLTPALLFEILFFVTIQTGWRSDSSLDFSRMGFKQRVKDCVVCWIRVLQDEDDAS